MIPLNAFRRSAKTMSYVYYVVLLGRYRNPNAGIVLETVSAHAPDKGAGKFRSGNRHFDVVAGETVEDNASDYLAVAL